MYKRQDYYLYTDDLRGSTVNVLDSSAGKVASYWYNDFGEVTENKADSYSSFNNELQYTGAVYDDSTGLLYLNARFYDPQTGRFISRDTYRGVPDNADTWHLYAYCANNPVNYVDPSGNLAISAGAIAAASAPMIAATAPITATFVNPFVNRFLIPCCFCVAIYRSPLLFIKNAIICIFM